jgi:hypothetical protein
MGADRLANGGRPSGWYPDPHDTAGLRYWNGESWTEHQARLTNPSVTPALCPCGVVAAGSCRSCGHAYCRAHIHDTDREDRAFGRVWPAWTCLSCIARAQRLLRSTQLQRCEDVALQLVLSPPLHRRRTVTGHRPRLVNLFPRVSGPDERAVRHATAYLIQYDGDGQDATYQGLAVSPDRTTVYDVGIPYVGVASDRIGPKRTLAGYLVIEEISIQRLREAAARPTNEPWFEVAARVFLRAGARLGIAPFEPQQLALLPGPAAPAAVKAAPDKKSKARPAAAGATAATAAASASTGSPAPA